MDPAVRLLRNCYSPAKLLGLQGQRVGEHGLSLDDPACFLAVARRLLGRLDVRRPRGGESL